MIFIKHLKNAFVAAVLFCGLSACGQQNNNATETQPTNSEVTEKEVSEGTAATSQEEIFHRLPTDVAKQRVYICDNASVSGFHVELECSLLKNCTGNFRNVTVLRAVEDYRQKNCEKCSPEFAKYFTAETMMK